MNSKRREKLKETVNKVYTIIHELEEIEQEEQDNLDNLPESLQSGEIGDKLQDNIDLLQEKKDELTDITTELESL